MLTTRDIAMVMGMVLLIVAAALVINAVYG
jgi:ABC-type dipeptide/oligopeptide/nickel transport system permease component